MMENKHNNTLNVVIKNKPVHKTDDQHRRNRVARLCNLLPLQENTTKKEAVVKKCERGHSSKNVISNLNNKCYCKQFTNATVRRKDEACTEKLIDKAHHSSISTDNHDSELNSIMKLTDEPRCMFCGLKLKEKRSKICDISLYNEMKENTEYSYHTSKSQDSQVHDKFDIKNPTKKDDLYDKWFLEVAEYRRTHWSDCHYVGKIE